MSLIEILAQARPYQAAIKSHEEAIKTEQIGLLGVELQLSASIVDTTKQLQQQLESRGISRLFLDIDTLRQDMAAQLDENNQAEAEEFLNLFERREEGFHLTVSDVSNWQNDDKEGVCFRLSNPYVSHPEKGGDNANPLGAPQMIDMRLWMESGSEQQIRKFQLIEGIDQLQGLAITAALAKGILAQAERLPQSL